MLWLVAGFASLAGFLFGYDLGLIGGALLNIRDAFHLSDWAAEIIVGAAKFGAFFGTFLGGALMLHYGRRKAIAIDSAFFVVGPLVMAASAGVIGLVVGRVIVGLGIGIAATVVPAYLGEVAPATARGRVVESFELLLCLGMLAAALGDAALQPLPGNWRWMVGVPVVPALLLSLSLCLLPESPRWLVIRGRLDEALAVIHRMYTHKILPAGMQHSTAEVEDELMQLWSSVEHDREAAEAQRAQHAERQRRLQEQRETKTAPLSSGSPGRGGEEAGGHRAGRWQRLQPVESGEVGEEEEGEGEEDGEGGGRHRAAAEAAAVEAGAAGVARRMQQAAAGAAAAANGASGSAVSPQPLTAAAAAAAAAVEDEEAEDQQFSLLAQGAAASGPAGSGSGSEACTEAGRPGFSPAQPVRPALPPPHTRSASAHSLEQAQLQSEEALLVMLPGQHPSAAAAAASGRAAGQEAGSPAAVPQGQQQALQQKTAEGEPPSPGSSGRGGEWLDELEVHAARQGQEPEPGQGQPVTSRHGASKAGFWRTLRDMLGDIKIVACGPERQALRMSLWLAFFNQAFASTSIINYAPQVLERAGVENHSAAALLTSTVGGSKMLGVLLSFFLVDSLGRRPLLLWGSLGCALALAALAVADWLALRVFLVASMCAFIFAFSVSWAGVFWVLLSELFSMSAKSPAASAATATLFLTGAVADTLFLTLHGWLGPIVFLIFALLATAAGLYVAAVVPETKGRRLESMAVPEPAGRAAWAPQGRPRPRPESGEAGLGSSSVAGSGSGSASHAASWWQRWRRPRRAQERQGLLPSGLPLSDGAVVVELPMQGHRPASS